MATEMNQYRPDYAVPPGWVLGERLEVQGISQAEFARRCGRSPKLISEIIAGKAPLEPTTALQFEKVLGVDASIWLGIESDYRLFKAREAEAEIAAAEPKWAERFPIREMVKLGVIEKPNSDADAVSLLLAFFGVASVHAWEARYSALNIAYRHSPSFESHEGALLVWLRLGELYATEQPCEEYNATDFKRATRQIRSLTLAPIEQALSKAARLCNDAGVALVLVPPLKGTAVSGAASWLSRRTPLLALSARHKSDDHLWFSFFHEAAHILLHGKNQVFVDALRGNHSNLEREADEWASNALVSKIAWQDFVATKPRSKNAVLTFARKHGIAPGIVVGMLQHEHHLPWPHLNGLKVRYEWR